MKGVSITKDMNMEFEYEIIDKEDTMQNENKSVEHDRVDQISELMYKLDMSCSKVEQCAFDSINMTDQVMNGMQKLLELVQTIMSQHTQVFNAMEISSLTLDEKEGENLIHLASDEATSLSILELELHKVAAVAMEANDAARCIEAGVAEQSENIAELIQCNEELLSEMDQH